MEILRGKIIEAADFQKVLVKIVDIEYFEGSLLTVFQNFKNSQIYLFDWVDKDKYSNRWMVYRSNAILIDKYIKGELSHNALFSSDELFCYFVQIDSSWSWENLIKIDKDKIPKLYMPKNDVYFEQNDCPDMPRLEEFVKAKTLRSRVRA